MTVIVDPEVPLWVKPPPIIAASALVQGFETPVLYEFPIVGVVVPKFRHVSMIEVDADAPINMRLFDA